MSFFSDVLESIGSDKAPAPPPRPIKRPTSTDPSDLSKPVAKLGINGASTPQNGTKRKAEEEHRRPSEKTMKTTPPAIPSSGFKSNQQPSSKDKVGQFLPQAKPPLSAMPAVSAPATAKVPPKGSFADIMARAKAAQEQKGQNQVGMIKHQATPREKMSKISERKRGEEEKAKALKSKLGPRPGSNGRIEKRRSASPAKKPAPKQPRPPVHTPTSSYKGTMKNPSTNKSSTAASKNMSSRAKAAQRKNQSRYDDYLGTDEEDDSDIEEDNGDDGYGSDASSDMEAGAFDIDEEESRALKAAKNDDAKELALEQQLKREKEERKRRLQALVDKRP